MAVVTVIPPTKKNKQIKRVAAYCRVSSGSDNQLHSFEAQNTYYKKIINSTDGWCLVDVYADEGVTGTCTTKRTEFQRLIKDCRDGKVDIILTKSISRFARNLHDCIDALRELKLLNIEVRFEKENINTTNEESEMYISMLSAMAQEESISISRNMRWSYQRRMQSGEFLSCSAPYGYNLTDGMLTVNEKEAADVRCIFKDYLSGKGAAQIANNLQAHGGTITERGVRYILTNERYIGDALLQKKYTTDTLPYRREINHGERDQYYVTDSHESIISRSDFYAVQSLMQCRTTHIIKTEKSVFSRMIVCGNCKATFKYTKIRGKVYWVCRTHYSGAEKCPYKGIRETEIQRLFIIVYNKLQFGMRHILEPLLKSLVRLKASANEKSELAKLYKEEKSLKEQNQILIRLNAKGYMDSAHCIERTNQIKQRLREIRDKISMNNQNDEIDKRIGSTNKLIGVLENSQKIIMEFDEDLFKKTVSRIIVNGDNIEFVLINDLHLTEIIHRK